MQLWAPFGTVSLSVYTIRLFIGLLKSRLIKATCRPDTASTARHSMSDHHLTRRFVLVTAARDEQVRYDRVDASEQGRPEKVTERTQQGKSATVTRAAYGARQVGKSRQLRPEHHGMATGCCHHVLSVGSADTPPIGMTMTPPWRHTLTSFPPLRAY